MKKLILSIITIPISVLAIYAQVGVGSLPKSGSVLDLTNSGNKCLILPVTSDPYSALVDTASLIYHNDNIYFRSENSIKILGPWKWDGDSAHSISSPLSSTVGIGIVPVAFAPFLLQINNAPADATVSASNASVLIGSPGSKHILIDNDELLAKSDSNSAGNLKLQEEGGTVNIGRSSNPVINTVLSIYGSLDSKGKIMENGNELIPVGSVIIWNGVTVPAGWALCDGGTYLLEDGTGSITTPNLMDRFVMGSDIAGMRDSGGTNVNTHSHDFDPPDFTSITEGEHDHSVAQAPFYWTLEHCIVWLLGGCNNHTGSYDNHSHSIPADSGAHFHEFDMPPATSAAASNTENRPPYFALAFIMKL